MVFRKKLSRGKLRGFLESHRRCVVAMEACGDAHYWGRESMRLGHEVKLIAPIYVKPYVKGWSYQPRSPVNGSTVADCRVERSLPAGERLRAWG